jgi:aminopeptidase N
MKNLIILLTLTLANINLFSQNINEYSCSSSKTKNFKFIDIEKQIKYTEKSYFNYDITYHRLEFVIDPSVRYIRGKITTYFKPLTSNFNQICFDFNSSLTADSVVWNNTKLSFTSQNDELLISIPQTLNINVLDSMSVYYKGIPPDNGLGSFEQTYHNSSPIIWTLSEPYGAKDWWPCKQNLKDKIDSIDVYITHSSLYKAASNGKLISANPNGGITSTHWKHLHPIATYLVAIAVTDYTDYTEYITLTTGETVPVLNYVFPESLGYAMANTHNVLNVIKLYSDLFIPYPYKNEKYGHAQFSWGGGMEHQTMSFMVNFEFFLMAHELAHQWFGDYITCGSWGDIWLNEGFATYLEGLCVENKLETISFSSFTAWKQSEINFITSRYNGSVYVTDTTNINRIFDSRLSYSKGGMVLHMLRKKVGDAAFFSGMQNYLLDTKLANKFASTADFKNHMEQTSGMDLTNFFDIWIYAQGYPIYTIDWQQNPINDVSIKLSQSQSSVTVDFFPSDVAIKFIGTSQDTTITFTNTFAGQEYVANLDFEVNSIIFDPQKDIIAKSIIRKIIDTDEQSTTITLSPNPSKDEIYVEFPQAVSPEKIIFTNSLGKIYLEYNNYNSPQNIFTFDINNLNTGVWFIGFYIDKKYIIKKFVKTE